MYDKRISGTFLYLFFWVICTSINCIPKHYFDFCLFVSTINNHYFWFIGKNRQMTAATFGLVGGQIDLKKCQKWPNIGQKCLWSQEGLTGGFCSSLGFFFPIIMPSSTFIFSSSIIFQRLFREIQDYPGIIQGYFWITKKKL